MPALTRWFIKTAFVYLVLALLLGVVLAARAVLPVPEMLNQLGPVYFHLLMVGWVTQLIFGVAHWMFPKFSTELPRGDERVMWAVYGLLNLGLILRVSGEPLLGGWVLAGPLVALAAILQWLAGLGAVSVLWGRVKVK